MEPIVKKACGMVWQLIIYESKCEATCEMFCILLKMWFSFFFNISLHLWCFSSFKITCQELAHLYCQTSLFVLLSRRLMQPTTTYSPRGCESLVHLKRLFKASSGGLWERFGMATFTITPQIRCRSPLCAKILALQFQGTITYPRKKGSWKDDVPLPFRWDMWSFPGRVYFIQLTWLGLGALDRFLACKRLVVDIPLPAIWHLKIGRFRKGNA